MGELPHHRTASPAGRLALSEAGSKSTSINVAVGRISGRTGLANDDLGQGNASGGRDLEDGSVGPCGGRGSEETGAARVLAGTLVVELDIVPVDQRTDLSVDLGIGTSCVDGREPGGDRGVGDDILAGGKGGT